MHYFAVKKQSQAQTTAKHKQLQKPALELQALMQLTLHTRGLPDLTFCNFDHSSQNWTIQRLHYIMESLSMQLML